MSVVFKKPTADGKHELVICIVDYQQHKNSHHRFIRHYEFTPQQWLTLTPRKRGELMKTNRLSVKKYEQFVCEQKKLIAGLNRVSDGAILL